MNENLLLTIMFFVFVFFVWIYTGGPNRPISFAGPYLTPITNVGQTSTGYGKPLSIGTGGTYNVNLPGVSGSATYSPGSSYSQNEALYGVSSPFRGKATLSGISLGYSGDRRRNPRQEYLSLSVNSQTPINITGWQLVSAVSGERGTIPQASPLGLNNGTRLTDIVVKSGERVYINSGTSPQTFSFKTNKCSSYLDVRREFTPSLSYSCPAPSDEFAKFFSGTPNEYQDCRRYSATLTSCALVPDRNPIDIPVKCVNFAKERLTYAGCLLGHQDDADFPGSEWRVFLDSEDPLWRDKDIIRLLDRDGKTVDVYSY